MEWNAVSKEKALEMMSTALNCRLSDEGLRISVISECLRSVLHQYSVNEKEEVRKAVASLRLTSAVRSKLMPLWPDVLDKDDDINPGVMSLLGSLAELGDMINLDGGKWLTAPPRAIRIDCKTAILIGGDPSYTFSTDVIMNSLGRVRLIKQEACIARFELWDANEWIGAPIEGLEEWSSKLLAKVSSGFFDAPSDMKESTAYVGRKWIHFSELPFHKKYIYLCRMPFNYGFSYFLGEIESGCLSRMNSFQSSDDVIRLRFFLDIKYNCPLKIYIKVSDGLAKLRLTRRLPKRESKVLLLGWRELPKRLERPGTTHHVFPEELLPIVRSAFEGLGIVWINEAK